MPTPEAVLARALFRTGTFLLITAWLLGSTWYIFVAFRDTYAEWGRWQTYPVPDKRAIKHVVALLVLIGADILFLWFGVFWFAG